MASILAKTIQIPNNLEYKQKLKNVSFDENRQPLIYMSLLG